MNKRYNGVKLPTNNNVNELLCKKSSSHTQKQRNNPTAAKSPTNEPFRWMILTKPYNDTKMPNIADPANNNWSREPTDGDIE